MITKAGLVSKLNKLGIEVVAGKVKKSDIRKAFAANMETCACCGKASEDSICSECENEGYWMDPAGTVHSKDDDPLKAYE
jgi:hypothetical protein